MKNFFSKIWDFFLDKNNSGDEKRLFGVLYAVNILIYSLVVHPALGAVLQAMGLTSLALLGGAVAGDKLNPAVPIAPAKNLISYFADLFLDKDGSGDEKRVLGNVFLGFGLVFPYQVSVDPNVYNLILLFGCALLGVAVAGDVLGPKVYSGNAPEEIKTSSKTSEV